MHDAAAGDGTLFSLESPGAVVSELEKAVKESIAAMDAKKAIDPTRRALCFIAVELARNISAGNRKARAVANEAAQLTATLQLIEGTEDTGSTDQLPDDVREFINALGSSPTPPAGAAPVFHTA